MPPATIPPPAAPKPSRLGPFLQRLLVWVLVLGTWEGAYRIIGWRPWKFPAPSHVLDSVLSMLDIDTAFGLPLHQGWPRPVEHAAPSGRPWYASQLITANLTSAARLVAGFVLSVSMGGFLGIALWRWAWLDRLLGPLLLGLQTLPSVCWVPVAVVLLGINETAILFVMVMGSAFAFSIALRDGLKTIPPLYQRAGLMLGARGWRFYRYVLLPASLPAFATSLRQGFSFAWRSLLGAELVMTAVDRRGLGFLLSTGQTQNDVSQVIAVMVVMVAIGMAADRWVFQKVQTAVNVRFGLA